MSKLTPQAYEALLEPLLIELSNAARWVAETGQRLVILFEGRDTAGKGGTIYTFSRSLNPRQCRVVALAAPTRRERGQWYFQRYVTHLPARGEIVLFDRSWYNRPGVERVMGFCSDQEAQEFLKAAPEFERHLVDSGILLFKYWLTCDQENQERRFAARLANPLKRWKLSPIDAEARRQYNDYTSAREEMLQATHTEWAPWTLVDFNDQPVGRLTLLRNLLDRLPDTKLPLPPMEWPELDGEPCIERFSVLAPIPAFQLSAALQEATLRQTPSLLANDEFVTPAVSAAPSLTNAPPSPITEQPSEERATKAHAAAAATPSGSLVHGATAVMPAAPPTDIPGATSRRGTMRAIRLFTTLTVFYAVLAGIVAAMIFLFPGWREYLPIGGAEQLLTQQPSRTGLDGAAVQVAQVRSLGESIAWLATAVAAALLTAVPVSWVYMEVRSEDEYDQSLISTIVILPGIVTSIVVIVQNSLALAFSLAGIAGAVRFRNSLKSSGDALFILCAVGIGLSAGIGATELAIVMSVAFNYCFLVLWTTEFGERRFMNRFLSDFRPDEAGSAEPKP
ncbi:MAG TPA: polyphosphate kinase 2 [Allosphingosinicella sp.]|nr:polyphosphate kinase 2 [Allosphingosinicella sp.]